MQPFLYLIGFLSAAALTWWGTRLFTEKKYSSRIQNLESKIRTTEGEAFQLKEQVGNLRGEVVFLQKTLSEERVSKREALTALSDSLRGALVGIGVMAFVVGGAMAGGLSWMAATWRMEAALAVQNTDQRIQLELTKLKLELLEKQFEKSEKDRNVFQTEWQKEQILRVEAETRLEALTGGVLRLQETGDLSLGSLDFQNPSNLLIQKQDRSEDLSLLKQVSF